MYIRACIVTEFFLPTQHLGFIHITSGDLQGKLLSQVLRGYPFQGWRDGDSLRVSSPKDTQNDLGLRSLKVNALKRMGCYGESSMDAYWLPDVKYSQWEFPVWLRELRLVLCNNLEGWDGEGGSRPRGHGYAHGWFMLTLKKPTQYCKAIILQLKISKFNIFWKVSALVTLLLFCPFVFSHC